jgi:1-acyl-sn-glycerol-3-phosphate acyltransferase
MAIARLLRRRRFAPLFVTQFLGALNDNLFKNALLVLATFHTATSAQHSAVLVNLAAGIFIAPFLLLSPLAGQLADKLERARLIRAVKLAEIGVMLLGAAALLLASVPLLLLALAAMGAQSAFFGPVKYAILPQHLHRDELVAGNALVELGTFLAILLGTTLGGLAMSEAATGPAIVALAVLAVAVAGWYASRAIPPAPAPSPELVLNHEPFGAATDTFRHARQSTPVWLSVMGISWFWFFGALILAQVPGYTRGVLHAGPQVATLLVCNHVSFVDALLIAAVSPRPVRFVMDHRIFALPVLRAVFRAGGAIPIAPAHEDPRMLERAYDAIAAALERGELVCIFPEGKITSDGELNPFKRGVERIVQRTPVSVVPLALRGLWGSFFSRHAGRAMHGLPRRLWSRLAVVSGAPVPAAQVSAECLQRAVAALRGEQR